MTAAPPPADAALAAKVREAILDSADAKRCFAERAAPDIAAAVHMVVDCLRAGGKILLCGNGGSAAEAQHISAEFVGRFRLERPPLASIALTTDTSALTSVANDYGYDAVFARQVEALGRPGDVLLAYSTSGTSSSIVKAIEKARELGLRSVGFTGDGGGTMADLCDVCIQAPSDVTAVIQECHSSAGHTLCMLAERILCGKESSSA